MGEPFRQMRSHAAPRQRRQAIRQASGVGLALFAAALSLPTQGWAHVPLGTAALFADAANVGPSSRLPVVPVPGSTGYRVASGISEAMGPSVQLRAVTVLRGQVSGQPAALQGAALQGVSLRQLSAQDVYRLDNHDQTASAGTARPVGDEHQRPKPREDPLEGMNRTFYKINDFLDRTFFRPLAMVYKSVFPKFMRAGIRNFFRNLNEPVTFINDILQAKPRRAIRTLARFTANSVYGVAGLFDVGKSFKLPYKRNGFGNTLGRWGMDPGPYLFLPLLGPTTFRDAGGQFVDSNTLVWAIGKPFNRQYYKIPRTVLTGLDRRVEVDDDMKTLMRDAADPYATIRSVYLQSRKAEIDRLRNRNSAIDPALEQDLIDPEANPAQAAAYGAYASGGVDGDLPPAPDVATDPAVRPGDPAISVAPLSDESETEQAIAADSPADTPEAP